MSDSEYVSIDKIELKRLQADSEELANLLAAQQKAEPVMQVSPEVSKQISKRGRDAIMAAERLVTLDESKTVSLEDMESRFGVEPATPSEDGREVPEVVGYGYWRDTLGWYGLGLQPGGSYTETDRRELMTVAQHERIVAAKDWEISTITAWWRAANVRALEAEEKVSKMEDCAQPARQVGAELEKIAAKIDSLEAASGFACGIGDELRALLGKEGE